MQPREVIVTTKPWYESATIILNGLFFLLTTYVQIFQLLTDQNVLVPLIGLFVHDPAQVAPIVTIIIQISTAINILLRLKTKAPVTK